VKSLSKNARTLIYLSLGVVGSFGLAFASVPLYQAFCSLTGIGGATRKAEIAPTFVAAEIAKRQVAVHFDTNTNGLDWDFKVETPTIDTHVGKTAIVYFKVKNNSDKPVTARATYNVLPDTMGPYFMKIECFCFIDQTLQPKEEKQFPVVYFLDPKLVEDTDAQKVRDVTLSYTFFASKDALN
jgi:cytochrome c oxidase assembly protein subunit 11